jgi:hypothetical protein
MTWGIKVQRLATALTVIGALALASGANWVDWFNFFFCW